MQKLITFLFLNLCITVAVYAQPTVSISDGVFSPGDTYVAEFSTRDFTDITRMNFSVTWDPAVLELVDVNGIDNNFFTPTFYDLSNANNGVMILRWTTANPMGIDLMDDRRLFAINFRVVGDCGTNTMVSIVDEPEAIVVNRVNTNTQNIGLLTEDALVGICTLPLIVNATTEVGEMGDQICIPITVENFDSVVVMQMTVSWDPTVLQFANIGMFSLPNLSVSNFNTQPSGLNSGQLSMSYDNANDGGLSVEDGRRIFTICFDLIGENGTSSPISFVDGTPPQGTPIEIIKFNYGGDNLGLINNDGRIFIRSQEGTTIVAPEEIANPNEEVCIPIRVRDFIDITSMESIVSWNPAVLEFVSATPTNALPGLLIDEVNVALGQLPLEWNISGNQAIILDNNISIFELCFRTVDERNTESDIAFLNTVFTNTEGQGFSGNIPGRIIIPGKNLQLIASEVAGKPGDAVCVPIQVINFENIESIEFPVNWETSILQFDSIGAYNLPFLDANSFNTNVAEFGNISVSWLDLGNNNGVTVPDSTAIFKLYFTVAENATVGACEAITFESFGAGNNDPSATVAATDGNEPFEATIETQNGESCVQNPNGFTINVETTNVDAGENECLEFKVFNFTEVVSAQFSVNWDNEILDFTDLINPQTLTGFDDNSFNTMQTDNGQLIVVWEGNSDGQGVNLADNTVIFELCFDAIGEPLACSDVEITDTPSLIEVTTAASMGEAISLNAENGELCINDQLTIIDSTIVAQSCPTEFDGSISIEVSGGQTPYNYLWNTSDPPENSQIQNLSAGSYSVTITDASGLSLLANFEVPLAGESPQAMAGIDTAFTCSADTLVLNANGSSMGADIIYNWTALNTGSVIRNGATLMPTIRGTDTYLLTVSNSVTGCQAEDEVIVNEGIILTADAGGAATICAGTEINLDGSRSSAGDNIIYVWNVLDAGNIVSGAETNTVTIDQPGTYGLIVQDTVNNCSVTDVVAVTLDENVPLADAGEDQQITCSENEITLTGVVNPPGNYRFFWETEGGIFTSDTTLVSVMVSSAGDYIFNVENLQTGCIGRDTVAVTADDSLPEAFAGADRVFNCNSTVIIIDDSSPNGDNFNYTWTAADGGTIVTGTENQLNVEVSSTGRYILMVTDNQTGCSASDELIITPVENTLIANAGADVNLNCGETAVQLNGTGSTDGDEIGIEWSPAENILINSNDRLQPSATQTGIYTLTITDAMTGCVVMDTVEVLNGGGEPIVIIAEPAEISCENNESILLDGSASDTGEGYVYSWQVIAGGATITNADMPIASVDAPGIFLLNVTTPTGCTGSASVEVIGSGELPMVNISPTDDLFIDCSTPELDLFGDIDVNENTFEWSTTDGNFTSSTDELIVTIDAAGTYLLTATNMESGCIATAVVTVSEGEDNVAVTIATPDIINCNQTEINLDATASSLTANTTILWNGVDGPILAGANTLQPTINTGGDYTLILVDTISGCQDQQTIAVTANLMMPIADAGVSQNITCGDPIILDGNNSTDADTYGWMALDGGQIDNSANVAAIQVSAAGTYILTAINSTSLCMAMDTVMVTADEALIPAFVAADFTNCGKADLTITAQPIQDDVLGEWTTLGDAFINDPTASQTTVSDLVDGENVFIWTQSTTSCPNYSSDTLIVTIAGGITANNDLKEYDENTTELTFDVTQNDVLTGVNNFSVQLLGEPAGGTINAFTNGNINYTAPASFSGEDEFEYEICNLDCENACDTALVRIVVEKSDEFQDSIATFIPSGITPNGDGANDVLIFDLLEINPEQYSDRELIVFNRWGDIVYSVKPYLNDWGGIANSGEELPQGTYYFILRLDIDDGEIIKGDVTILK
ncbi:MAG: cohesin domain-containing protein [Saprospiraceae bacterium]